MASLPLVTQEKACRLYLKIARVFSVLFIHFNVPEAEGGIKWIHNAYLKLHPCKRAGKGPTAATGGKVCNAAGWKEPPVCDDDVDRMVKKGAGPERPLAMCIGIKR